MTRVVFVVPKEFAGPPAAEKGHVIAIAQDTIEIETVQKFFVLAGKLPRKEDHRFPCWYV